MVLLLVITDTIMEDTLIGTQRELWPHEMFTYIIIDISKIEHEFLKNK
jgi:hypothetical protein